VKTALITGAAGFIGRHITERLIKDGWAVNAVDIQDHPHQGDNYRDARDLFAYRDIYYDLVVHCAAHVGGRRDIEGRPTYLAAVNLQLDAALFEWALRTRPAHIIYWSSSAAYPIWMQNEDGHEIVPQLKESDIDVLAPDIPDCTYGWVKLCGERLAREAEAEGLRVHVFRPFSGWAADQSTDYPMGAFLDRARRRADPFEIWGDGEQVRDWIHVDDLISAALTAIDQDYPGTLNLCTGTPTSFNQLAELVCKSVGYAPQIHHRLDSPVGVRYRVGDPSEMLKVYQPKIGLEEGVGAALQVG
jgi:nucleoside-diphosphate-sugar epimerase